MYPSHARFKKEEHLARCPVRAAADRRRPPDGRPMAGSIFSNIVGNSNLGIDAAWDATRMAGLEDDIKAMPIGMHTVASEGVETFSEASTS